MNARNTTLPCWKIIKFIRTNWFGNKGKNLKENVWGRTFRLNFVFVCSERPLTTKSKLQLLQVGCSTQKHYCDCCDFFGIGDTIRTHQNIYWSPICGILNSLIPKLYSPHLIFLFLLAYFRKSKLQQLFKFLQTFSSFLNFLNYLPLLKVTWTNRYKKYLSSIGWQKVTKITTLEFLFSGPSNGFLIKSILLKKIFPDHNLYSLSRTRSPCKLHPLPPPWNV